jgi:hypothetical protein
MVTVIILRPVDGHRTGDMVEMNDDRALELLDAGLVEVHGAP